MANVAQTINCIHSLFLAQGDNFVRTPVYYIFEMYRGHMQSQVAQMNIHCDELKVPSRSGTATMAALSGSASVKGKSLTVTLTNPSLDSAVAARIRLAGGSIVEGQGTVLAHADMTAGNTFHHPDEVKPAPFPVTIRGNGAEISLPQRAVVSLDLRMA